MRTLAVPKAAERWSLTSLRADGVIASECHCGNASMRWKNHTRRAGNPGNVGLPVKIS
jgi:hypothetical protein